MTDYRSRPRRRGRELEDAILTATIAELRDVGFVGMTMDSVARRAGAGKVSVYRRWPGRIELAMAAAYRLVGEPPVLPEPSTLRADLLALFRFEAEQASGPAGEAMRGVVAECLRRQDATAMAAASRGASTGHVLAVVRRAAARGEPVDPNPPLIRLQAGPAMLQHHLLLHGPPMADEFVITVVDEVALPLLLSPIRT